MEMDQDYVMICTALSCSILWEKQWEAKEMKRKVCPPNDDVME
jgi:hypothetical protein